MKVGAGHDDLAIGLDGGVVTEVVASAGDVERCFAAASETRVHISGVAALAAGTHTVEISSKTAATSSPSGSGPIAAEPASVER